MNSAPPTAHERELLLYEIVDGRQCRLEWRNGNELWLADGDQECEVDPGQVLRLLSDHARTRPAAPSAAAVAAGTTQDGQRS
ncbi:hypothetical protein [Streptomyces sp. NPDC006997]|uniref:hypothetical protein n=1 Tax=Streptomyces sp. NPDC006997 TaxID=3155356 RepID=UPI00340E3F4D